MNDKTTHFGFQQVAESEKASKVRGVFSSVAGSYDVMNDLMSFGLHRLWKDAMVSRLAPPRSGRRPFKVLDMAGGTGDIAFRFLDRAPKAQVTVCDMTESMLVEGRKRAEAQDRPDRLSWVTGDAMALPILDALKAVTLLPARQLGEEKVKGSIAAGKLADFAVLSANPLKTPADKLGEIRVVGTVKEGVTVFSSNEGGVPITR